MPECGQRGIIRNRPLWRAVVSESHISRVSGIGLPFVTRGAGLYKVPFRRIMDDRPLISPLIEVLGLPFLDRSTS